MSFLSGVTGADVSDINFNGYFILCKAVEPTLNLSAPNILLPLHFRESSLLYGLKRSWLAFSIVASGCSLRNYQVK